MSIVNKALSTWGSIVNKFWQFSDGKTAPGQVLLDPATGEPIERFGSYNPTWEERFLAEGEPISLYGNGSVMPASGAVNTQIVATGLQPPLIGKAMWIDVIMASTDKAGIFQVNVSGSADTRFPGVTKQFVAPAGGGVVVPVRQLFRGFQAQTGYVSLACRRMLSASPGMDTVYGAISATGWAITDDFDWSAPKVALFVGDSILNGTGPTATSKMWPFLAKSYWRSLGTRVRIVLKSVSGSTTSEHETWRSRGYHDIPQVDIVVYALGVNDAGGAVADNTYTANLAAFWAHVSKRWPAAKMIVCGPTPIENNTAETRAVGLRAAGAAWVAAQDNPRLQFIDLGAAFDRTVSGNYAASDTPGSRVHPNDTGNAAVASAFQAAWPGLGITI